MINKVHIRYEDDVFNGEHPFSCGIVIDVRTINKFKSLNPFFYRNYHGKQQTRNGNLTLLPKPIQVIKRAILTQ